MNATPTVDKSAESGSSLIVGPAVKLKGAEIQDCDTLVVEGRVEATMDSRVIRIAEGGAFSGKVVIDVADRARPRLISHRDGAPPFGGGTHNCLPLPDRDLLIVLDEAVLDHQEDGVKNIWVFDNRDKSNPGVIATFPQPGEAHYRSKGGHFGPHNIHENRPGTFIGSELIFATYQNAGVRVFDVRNARMPVSRSTGQLSAR